MIPCSCRPLSFCYANTIYTKKQQTKTIIIWFYLLKGYFNYSLYYKTVCVCVSFALSFLIICSAPDDRNVPAIKYSNETQNIIIPKISACRTYVATFNYPEIMLTNWRSFCGVHIFFKWFFRFFFFSIFNNKNSLPLQHFFLLFLHFFLF